MSATKLVPDEELAVLGARRAPGAPRPIFSRNSVRRALQARMYLPFAILRVATLSSTSLPTAHLNTEQLTSF